jgi:hypothetical protein
MSANEAERLSRTLFEARELLDMYADVVFQMTDRHDPWINSTRDGIDAYRRERGWSPNGFGGEVDS